MYYLYFGGGCLSAEMKIFKVKIIFCGEGRRDVENMIMDQLISDRNSCKEKVGSLFVEERLSTKL